ncbi:hypothetical protein VNO78_23803 [Psophocarpus tetragonolobus]|uniref:YLP motif-containing protein 1 n=1 Tax=Psophocarpus tetragonolobus TaxID=3891 RepID=A0AAN9S4T9_PSOTE
MVLYGVRRSARSRHRHWERKEGDKSVHLVVPSWVAMDRQWRPNPPPIQIQPNLCPICFLSHFPFCPSPSPSPSPSPFPYPPNLKRPRIDDYPLSFSEDERRLKLIRDHGSNPPRAFPPAPAPAPAAHHLHNAPFISHHNTQHAFNGRLPPSLSPSPSPSPYAYPYPYPYHTNTSSDNMDPSRFFRPPPLPSSPPPPLPIEPSINHFNTYFSPPQKPPSLFPVPVTSSPSSFSQLPDPLPPFYPNAFPSEDPSNHYLPDSQPFPLNQFSVDTPKFIDASHLFRHPHRASRPDHFVIIFRGLPGSGKSYLAKMLRDFEVENGGDAPRIHSMDDYFMTEVEKVEDGEASKSSSSGRNKKPVMKKVMEYCYEPEMEEAYRSSMLKAFRKTVEEGVFTFIIVDDRNLRVADFAQFWATAKGMDLKRDNRYQAITLNGEVKATSCTLCSLLNELPPTENSSLWRSGYEVYILEATYKDPAGCAARNVHGFTQEDIEKMSKQWEEAPSLYLQLDVKSLFHGDDLKESRIQEVDMDTEDDLGDALPPVQGREAEKVVDPPVREDATGRKWDAEGEHPAEVRELGKSKWSDDLGEDDIDKIEGMKGNINALSGLIRQYGKDRKSVHWGDQTATTNSGKTCFCGFYYIAISLISAPAPLSLQFSFQGGKTGFSIGAARKVNALSLVIGPGAGYNLKSNPLPEEDSPTHNSVESKKHSVFQERIRAERESFKAVFDRRRHRIGGLDAEED